MSNAGQQNNMNDNEGNPSSGIGGRLMDDAGLSQNISSIQVTSEGTMFDDDAQVALGQKKGGRLRRLSKLYGRDTEREQMFAEYQKSMTRSTSGSNCNNHNNNDRTSVDAAGMVLVSGNDGVGKTAVATMLRDTVQEQEGFFITWKFEPFQCRLLRAGDDFEDAFTDLCRQIMESSERVRYEASEAILRAIQGPDDHTTLLGMIPGLEAIIGREKHISCTGINDDTKLCINKTSKNEASTASVPHLQLLIRFLRSLAVNGRPFVLLLEGIEFIDTRSLMMLQQVIPSLNTIGGLCIATMHQAALQDKNIAKLLEGFGESVRVTRMELQALKGEVMNEMVADLLAVDKEVSLPMSQFLYDRSSGNVLFAKELLQLMYDMRVLEFDDQTKTWNCQEEQMERICHCNDFQSLIATRMENSSDALQDLLKVAACLGFRVDMQLIELAMPSAIVKHDYIQVAVEFGLMASIQTPGKSRIFRFTHNVIRKCIYDLIPELERNWFHLAIGQKLWKGLKKPDLYKNISLVLGQIKMGESFMTDQTERYAIAELCLGAAEKALAWSGFYIAQECLEFGISILGANCWHDQYNLTLALHNVGAELCHAVGSFPRALELVEAILHHAMVFEDTIQAHCTKLYVLGSIANIDSAIEAGLEFLQQLGEPLPANPTAKHLHREHVRMRRYMKNKTPEMLSTRLHTMTDKRKAAELHVINLLFCPAFIARPFLAPLLAIRGMRITTTHGLCAISCYMFGIYGMFVCSFIGDIQLGTRYADVALDLLHRFGERAWLPRVYVAVYGAVYGWSKNIRKCTEYLHRGQQIGLETGDNHFAILLANIRISYLFAIGEPMPKLKTELDAYADKMKALNQISMLTLLERISHILTALMEGDGSTVFLEKLYQDASDIGETPVGLFWDCWKSVQISLVAYIMGNFQFAQSESGKATAVDHFPFKSFDMAFFHCCFSLIRIGHYRATGKGKRRAIAAARYRIKQMEAFCLFNAHFCLGKIALIQAEVAAITGRHVVAHKLYITATALFESQQSLMELAIAKELTGRHMMEYKIGNGCGRDYLEEAMQVFGAWGAKGKANMLKLKSKPSRQLAKESRMML